MRYMAKGTGGTLHGAIIVKTKVVPVRYKEVSGVTYAMNNSTSISNFPAVATVQLDTLYGLSVNDRFRLQGGQELRVLGISPINHTGKGMLSKSAAKGFVVTLG